MVLQALHVFGHSEPSKGSLGFAIGVLKVG
jgi:hypothetical protein